MILLDSYICKYHSATHGKKNGKACVLDPDNPKRCMPFYYETDCENYEEEDLEELIDGLDCT